MLKFESLGRMIIEKRGKSGIRAAAKEIGISPSTLSRVENGHLPDLENYKKLCEWLGVDITTITQNSGLADKPDIARVHFKKDAAIKQETAHALAELILAAQRALALQER
jgi:transcriptional regulator with XRE-family HTH domain